MTIMFSVMLAACSIRKVSMKQAGMAAPTIRPERTPRLAMITTITRMEAVISPDSSRMSMRAIWSLWSKLKAVCIVDGQDFCSSATACLIDLTVPRMLAPGRLVTSRAKAGLPL